MNAKKISIGAVIIIIIAIGLYFVIKNAGTKATSGAQSASAAAATDAATTVQANDIVVGTGTEAVPGSTVSVLYEGRFTNGTVFDSSAAHGNVPYTFKMYATPGPIAGFHIGINGMKVGGERRIAIPPALAYGSDDYKDGNGKVVIPGNSTLVFDVKLVKVELPTAGAPQTSDQKASQ